jgi:cyanophycinase
MVRMAPCIVTNPGCIGIGLEVDTAVYITEGREMLVLRSGLITVVEGIHLTCSYTYKISTGQSFLVRDLRIHLLAEGERTPCPPSTICTSKACLCRSLMKLWRDL